MRIPGPADVMTFPSLVQKGVSSAVEDVSGMMDVIRRAGELMGRTERLVHRAELLITRAGDALERVEDLVDEIDRTAHRATEVIATAGAVADNATITTARADELITSSVAVTARAGQTVELAGEATALATGVVTGAGGLLGRSEGMLDRWSGLSDRVHPWASRVSESVEDAEVEAIVRMIDRLPRVAQHLDEEVVPLLGQLEQIRPDVHDILESVNDLSLAIKGLPGIGLFKRRGEKIEEEEDSQESGDDQE